MMAGPGMDKFEAYFKRADLDGDGRISGAEAVGFFQGSGLPKQVLAQIWMHADQSRSGFLGRQEFFNALRLVTVAQSKRDLTPEIVKAAIHSPAAAKIPPPQINLPVAPGQQLNSGASAPPQISSVSSTAIQNPGFRRPEASSAVSNQPYFTPQQNQLMRPTHMMPSNTAPRPPFVTACPEYTGGSLRGQIPALPSSTVSHLRQVGPTGTSGSGSSNTVSNDWYSPSGGSSTGLIRAAAPSIPSAVQIPQSPVSMSMQPAANDSKALVISENKSPSPSGFGGDMFSETSLQQKPDSLVPGYSGISTPTSSATAPASSMAQPLGKMNSLDSLQSAFSVLPAGNQVQQARPVVSSQPQVPSQGSALVATSTNSLGANSAGPGNNQLPLPKMKPSDIQKYSKVFMEVDADKDGKITGEQARNLFLSWRLPREVLKHVWDLSDQDNDTMLSLREFCFALYLMERYREGRPLPVTLPNNVMFDETLLSMTGPPSVNHANVGWAPGPGFGQQSGMGAPPMTPQAGTRLPGPAPVPRPGSGVASNKAKPQGAAFDEFANHVDSREQNAMGQHFEEAATETDKVEEKQVILDSREKIEFYRSKMQDIVLYKSRCDNRFNEISERASADKREAEILSKKYEEKYQQVAEIASKLTIEEARFREVQERKVELNQAIINMQQGGSADGLLQVRADRIQSDLEELMKALTERCMKHGLDIQSKALVELPNGWQPGIQEGAALWDEEWDKFEDEGFGNELTFNVTEQTDQSQKENGSVEDHNLSPDSSSHLDDKSGLFSSTPEHEHESESAYTHSEDESARSPRDRPGARTSVDMSSPVYSHGKNAESDHETNRFFDDSNWGAFDNDDTDSVWGFNDSKTKDSDFYGSSDFGVNPARFGSPTSETATHRKSPLVFDDSVPSTPLSRFGNSPPRFSSALSGQENFDSISRFDSFSGMTDNYTGFDSTNSTRDFGGFSRFDSISSSQDFGRGGGLLRFDSMNSSRDFGGSKLARFDSVNSSKEGFAFDDSDPFGSSGPFKVSSENASPKKSSDSRYAF